MKLWKCFTKCQVKCFLFSRPMTCSGVLIVLLASMTASTASLPCQDRVLMPISSKNTNSALLSHTSCASSCHITSLTLELLLTRFFCGGLLCWILFKFLDWRFLNIIHVYVILRVLVIINEVNNLFIVIFVRLTGIECVKLN